MDIENTEGSAAVHGGQMDSGKILYEQYLNGDNNAFVQLIENFKNPLMLFINTFVNNIHIAEELTQETFVRIGLDKPRFSGKCSFRTWLYAIGKNVASGYLRKITREQPAEDSEFEFLSDDKADIEREYLMDEDRIEVHRAMEKLSDVYRQVLWLSYFEELDNGEIAKILKKTRHGVETLKYRAKGALRIILEKEGFIYENR